MPNILLTQRCVRKCPYCFADKHMAESSPDEMMSWENLIYLADLMMNSGEQHFPLLGGEPTLHPEFNGFVAYLLERGFNINVFTSGILKDSTLEEAAGMFLNVPKERLYFTMNINNPDQTKTPEAEIESARRFMKIFGERIGPGFNIYRTDYELDFLFQLINEFNLNRTIRIGLTHPIVGQKNSFIGIDDIDTIIERLFSYIPQFERYRIRPGLDCGFPMCKFTDDQLAWLYKFTGAHYRFGCGPVVDIGPDMMVWPCFPLSSFRKRSIFEFNSIKEVVDYYFDIHGKIKVESGGIYLECDNCMHREEGFCRGGCVAHNLNHFDKEPKLRFPEVYL